MPDWSDIVYTYDGSFDGLMCCVCESYYKREMPFEIRPVAGPRSQLFDEKFIGTERDLAERAYTAITRKISPQAQELVDLSFLTCLGDKELTILKFLRLGFRIGAPVMNMITDDSVYKLQKAVKNLTIESHKLKGFVRFSVCEGVLISVIEPKNFVLPLLEPHFCDRYQNESFMIYDKAHKFALVFADSKSVITDLEEYEMPVSDPVETEFRHLWKQFYNTISIEGRYNPRCRMSHMPKRFWRHLTEFADDDTRQVMITD